MKDFAFVVLFVTALQFAFLYVKEKIKREDLEQEINCLRLSNQTKDTQIEVLKYQLNLMK